MICTMLYCVRTISLDIWCVERYVCFWSSCLTGLSSSSTVVPFSSVTHTFRSAIYAFSRSRFSNLLVKWPVLLFCVLFSKILSVSSANRILWTGIMFLLLNGMLQCRYFVTALKAITHNNIICFCQINFFFFFLRAKAATAFSTS